MHRKSFDPRRYIDEVAFWLRLSKYFYKAFDLSRNLGPQYFLINSLLEAPKRTSTVSDLSTTLQTFSAIGKNATSDISILLEDLRKLQYVKILAKSEAGEEAIELRTTKTERYLPAEATVQIRPELELGRADYTGQVMEELFGREVSDAQSAASSIIMQKTFEFVVTKYLPNWSELLEHISVHSAALGKTGKGAIKKKLLASTEYFILLHCLWEASLQRGGIREVSLKRLKASADFARPIKLSKFTTCILFLESQNVVRRKAELVQLDARLDIFFDEYAVKFVEMRPMLRDHLSRNLCLY